MEEKVLPNTALGLFEDGSDGWKVIRIQYNGQTGDVGKIEKLTDGMGKTDAEIKFKVKVIEEKVF